MKVEFVGCSAPYREAIESRLVDVSAGDESTVWLVLCGSDDQWGELSQRCDEEQVVVAVLPNLEVEDYVRAFVSGASGAVYLDTSSSITVDVIKAAQHGEALLPLQAVRAMATSARRLEATFEVSDHEKELLRAVAQGKTIAQLAHAQFFSERTVRRHLQSLYLKLGVQNRAEAIASAARMGLLD